MFLLERYQEKRKESIKQYYVFILLAKISSRFITKINTVSIEPSTTIVKDITSVKLNNVRI